MLGLKYAPLKTWLSQLSDEFETSLNLGPIPDVTARIRQP
jgi:hypothetical protein